MRRFADQITNHEKLTSNKTATVYRIVPKGEAIKINEQGIALSGEIITDERDKITQEIEDIFEEVLSENIQTTRINRKRCLYAFPNNPKEESVGLPYRPDVHDLIAFKVNPKIALVCEGEFFTEAAVALRRSQDKEKGMTEVRDWAKEYWDSAMPLSEYLELHNNNEDDFYFPEVLIFESVSKDDIIT